MQVKPLGVTQYQAIAALADYKQHRAVYDKRDWEIERIYRAISKGKIVIDAFAAIRSAGVDGEGLPRLAICEAHAHRCICSCSTDEVTFGIDDGTPGSRGMGRRD
jgi:hypothetical protein